MIDKIEEIDRKALTDFSVAGGDQAIDLYVDYVADKVDEIASSFNELVDLVESIYFDFEDMKDRLRNI